MKGTFQYADDKEHFVAVWPVPVNRALRDGGGRDAAEYCPEGQDAAAQPELNQIGAGSLQIARTCARRESRPPGSLSGAPAQQLPLRTDAGALADRQHPDHQFTVNRWAANRAVRPIFIVMRTPIAPVRYWNTDGQIQIP